MANTIKIKRRPASGSAGKPSSLYNGELAFNENDNILYYGYGSGVGGVASSIEQIGGSGYFAHRGGINASGLWPISVTGNAATVTNGVYTTGNQNIGGIKRFTSQVEISGSLSPFLLFKSASAANNGNIVFDGINYENTTQSSYISSSTGNMEIAHGTKIQLNSELEVKAPNTSNSGVEYFAVFESNPNSSLTTLKSVSKSQILDDIGAATSGLDITAGSGLVGGGTLSQNRRFDIGQGDGITVNADSIAVNSTVVRTTGAQSIDGQKTMSDVIFNGSIQFVNLSGITGNANFIPVFKEVQSPDTEQSPLVFISNSDFKIDLGLNNVTNDAQIKKIASSTSGNIPFWNGTTGDLLANGYGVETVLTGNSSNLPRADAVKTYVDNMIVSGIATNDAMIFKGAIDCSTNPNYPAADRGWTYKISVAGKIGGVSGVAVEVNDTVICTTDGTSTGTYAAVGSNWIILQTNIADASILVTGPTSVNSDNIAIFDGSTGKIIKDGFIAATDIARLSTTQTFTGEKTFGSVAYFGGSGISNGGIFCRTVTGYEVVGIEPNNGITVRNENINGPSFNVAQNNGTVLFAISGAYVGTGIWNATTIAVNKGGTGQTSYTDGQLLIGNTTGNTLTKATLTEGTGIDITNGAGSITIAHEDTSTLTGAQGSNGIASITVDGLGHVTAVTTATYLTAGTVCAAIVDCALDGGSF
jgi:hypothetical protein